ncbi:MAG TPA: mycofactocin radical SAM maturase, partial [Streptosporangiaceae bacterium]|nr:mycofactocin radical SAM maturase [Streptosporangiaceae bacterium]
DPECVRGHGQAALAAVRGNVVPRPDGDHSHRPVPVTIGRRPPHRACDESPPTGRAEHSNT